MSISKSEISDGMLRAMHREPALRQPGNAPTPQRQQPASASEPEKGMDAAPKKPRRAKMPNATEREYETMLYESLPGATIRWEAYTLRLADNCTYTPDFSVLSTSGELSFYEVKGPYIFPKALVKPRLAAAMFEHPIYLAQKKKTGWEVSQFSPTKH